MTWIDYSVVGLYLVALVVLGLVLARRAGRDAESYFLGNHKIPWWALGASGMSSNLDVAGTMTIVSLLYLYGLHGFFIEFRGGVVLPIAVFLAFMGRWHRRSAVMTTAEWMELRFGKGVQGKAARLTAALTYLIITVAMVVFFLTAAGSFLAAFLPWSPTTCAIGAAAIALGYTLISGLHGVVWTDVIQAVLIAAAAIYVAIVGSAQATPEILARWPGAGLATYLPLGAGEALGSYNPFLLFLAGWAAKGILEGLGGSPGSAYMAQRFYAAGSDRDCLRIGMLWTVLFAFRWPMILGFTLLALALNLDGGAGTEALLPAVLQSDYFPAGVRGLVLAAMLAAAMSTFDSTINAGASYLVRDVFQLFRPQARERELVWAGYIASFLIVAVGLGMALWMGRGILEVWTGIVIQLFPAFLVPFALRWYWHRLNGAGFTAGVAAGFIAAQSIPAGWSEFSTLAAISLASAVVTVAVALATRPTPEETARTFCARVRPWGTWPAAWSDARPAGDVALLGVALAWQIVTFLTPMALVLRHGMAAAVLVALWVALFGILLRHDRRLGAAAQSP